MVSAFNDNLRQGFDASAFITGCNSWYIDANGRIVTNWWGNVASYQQQAAAFEPQEFEQIAAASEPV